MRSSRLITLPIAALLALGACSDSSTPLTAPFPTVASGSVSRGLFHKYVALGTGFTEGVRSGGLTAQSQDESWPADLARLAGRELSAPYVAAPGCPPPLIPPLLSGATEGQLTGPCALAARVTLPAQNLGILSATVASALNATVENASAVDSSYGFSSILRFVLPPSGTQVGAMASLKPKIVSVEYGSSEIMRQFRQPSPPFSITKWVESYDAILDAVVDQADRVVLALPPVTAPPAYIPGFQLAQNAAQLLTVYNVMLPDACLTGAMMRYIHVGVITGTVRAGLAARAAGQAPVVMDCSSQPFLNQFSFSSDRLESVTMIASQMRSHIRQQADARGLAYFDLNLVYSTVPQPALNIVSLMTSSEPFGPYVSLDGIYPSAAGNRLLADAAATALNGRYDLALPVAIP